MAMVKNQRALRMEHFASAQIYEKQRVDVRERLTRLRAQRQLPLGPWCTAHFENWETLWFQVQETAYVEGFGARELQREVAAYAGLVPAADEVVARLEIDASAGAQLPGGLCSLESLGTLTQLCVDSGPVPGRVEYSPWVSSVHGEPCVLHYVRFALSPIESLSLISCRHPAQFQIDHPLYQAETALSPSLRMSLAADWSGL